MGFGGKGEAPLLDRFGRAAGGVVGGWVKWGLFIAVFLTAYCAQPLLVDLIKINGGAHSSTFLFLLPHYASMLLVGLMPRKVPLRDCDWRTALGLAAIDICNQLLKKAGLVFAGAAVYIVIDSSSIVWTAIWSVVLLKRRLSAVQWFAIGMIFFGVAMKAVMIEISFSNNEFLGVLFITLASMSMGLNFVLNEHFMSRSKKPIPGPNLVCLMGMFCTSCLLIWTFVWTIPRFDELVLQKIARAQGSPKVIILAFCSLLVTGTIHSSTFWYIIKNMGAISSGVLKGLKVAAVFVMSHVFFCETQKNQCLTPASSLSALVCVLGVVLYSTSTTFIHRRHKEQERAEEEAERLRISAQWPQTADDQSAGFKARRGKSRRLRKSVMRVEADEALVHNSSMIFSHAANSSINSLASFARLAASQSGGTLNGNQGVGTAGLVEYELSGGAKVEVPPRETRGTESAD